MAMSDTDRPGDEEQQWDNDSYDPFGGDGNAENDTADEPLEDSPEEFEEYHEGDGFDEPGELDLGDDDASLPWLEGDEDFDEESGGASFLLLALLALGALGLIIGGIWWFTRDRGQTDLVADGSVIEAPEEPYKEKPEDPGGKTFDGTGDTSYAVSEGETRTAQLGGDKESAKPGFDAVGASGSSAAASAANSKPATSADAVSKPAEASAAAGPGVQVGAYSSRSSAEAGWRSLSAAHSALSGMKYRIVEGKADIGTVFRLQALPGDAAAARSLCASLKAAGQDCAVKN